MKIYSKRKAALYLACLMALSAGGCGSKTADLSYAMMTADCYMGNKAAAQTWLGVQEYATKSGVCAARYEVNPEDDKAAREQIKSAVKQGASAVVCIGSRMEKLLYEAQNSHGKVRFVMIGGQPRVSEEAEASIGSNTLCVVFDNAELGYLAGYSAVYEGYRHLGFIGGNCSAEALDYESGFIAGVKACAADMALEGGAVVVDEYYAGSDVLSPMVMEKAINLYDDGAQIIMTSGHQISRAVIAGAEKRSGLVITGGEDMRSDSPNVLIGCAFNCTKAAEAALRSCSSDSFTGGTSAHYGAAEESIELCLDFSRFSTFTEADYQRIYGELSSGARTVPEGHDTQGDGFVTVNVIG